MSERVRDKIAASRRKGKWTGGTVPLGYEARDKKLAINKTEAETVRTIFRLYLELGSFGKLVAELDHRGIVTKRRTSKVAKYNGGISFGYGPLAYFLKNRVYVGQVHHSGKWFEGEHEGILDRKSFESVQELLKSNATGRKIKRSESGALLQGKLFDDKGNLMSPSFSTKNGVRYRFYVSSALLRGRKQAAGSVTRVSATAIEHVIIQALRAEHPNLEIEDAGLVTRLYSARLGKDEIAVAVQQPDIPAQNGEGRSPITETRIPWNSPERTIAVPQFAPRTGEGDQKIFQALIRAHCWAAALTNNDFISIEQLAATVKLHPKVVRSELRLAFLAPHILGSALSGEFTSGLPKLRNISALSWRKQLEQLNWTA